MRAETGENATENSVYAIASVSKHFTSLLLGQVMKEEGEMRVFCDRAKRNRACVCLKTSVNISNETATKNTLSRTNKTDIIPRRRSPMANLHVAVICPRRFSHVEHTGTGHTRRRPVLC